MELQAAHLGLQCAEWQHSKLNIIDAVTFTLLWLSVDFPSYTSRVMVFLVCERQKQFFEREETIIIYTKLISCQSGKSSEADFISLSHTDNVR